MFRVSTLMCECFVERENDRLIRGRVYDLMSSEPCVFPIHYHLCNTALLGAVCHVSVWLSVSSHVRKRENPSILEKY